MFLNLFVNVFLFFPRQTELTEFALHFAILSIDKPTILFAFAFFNFFSVSCNFLSARFDFKFSSFSRSHYTVQKFQVRKKYEKKSKYTKYFALSSEKRQLKKGYLIFFKIG